MYNQIKHIWYVMMLFDTRQLFISFTLIRLSINPIPRQYGVLWSYQRFDISDINYIANNIIPCALISPVISITNVFRFTFVMVTLFKFPRIESPSSLGHTYIFALKCKISKKKIIWPNIEFRCLSKLYLDYP